MESQTENALCVVEKQLSLSCIVQKECPPESFPIYTVDKLDRKQETSVNLKSLYVYMVCLHTVQHKYMCSTKEGEMHETVLQYNCSASLVEITEI